VVSEESVVLGTLDSSTHHVHISVWAASSMPRSLPSNRKIGAGVLSFDYRVLKSDEMKAAIQDKVSCNNHMPHIKNFKPD
jgi:hypothetical protein